MIDLKWNELRKKLDNMVITKFGREVDNIWHVEGLGNCVIEILHEHFKVSEQ